MKRHFTLFVVAISLFVITSSSTLKNQGEIENTGNAVYTFQGKNFFVLSTPSAPYTVVDKISSYDQKKAAKKYSIISDFGRFMLSVQDQKEDEDKGKAPKFDAVIIYGVMKKAELIKFNGTPDFTAKVLNKKVAGAGRKDIYILSEPTRKYKVLTTIDVSTVGSMFVANTAQDAWGMCIDKAVGKAKKELGKDENAFDGIIMTFNSDKSLQSLAIGDALSSDFGKNIQVIKYE